SSSAIGLSAFDSTGSFAFISFSSSSTSASGFFTKHGQHVFLHRAQHAHLKQHMKIEMMLKTITKNSKIIVLFMLPKSWQNSFSRNVDSNAIELNKQSPSSSMTTSADEITLAANSPNDPYNPSCPTIIAQV